MFNNVRRFFRKEDTLYWQRYVHTSSIQHTFQIQSPFAIIMISTVMGFLVSIWFWCCVDLCSFRYKSISDVRYWCTGRTSEVQSCSVGLRSRHRAGEVHPLQPRQIMSSWNFVEAWSSLAAVTENSWQGIYGPYSGVMVKCPHTFGHAAYDRKIYALKRPSAGFHCTRWTAAF